MVTIEYRCADGTPFPVVFADEADAALVWQREREHNPEPLTPLADALAPLGFPGTERAATEAGLPVPRPFRPGPQAQGFAYSCATPMADDEMAAMVDGCSRLVDEYGSALGIWQRFSRPRVQEACRTLAEAGDCAPLADLAALQQYALQLTMVPAYVGGNDLELLAAVCSQALGGDGSLAAYELTQGHENETLLADRALWQLGRAARRAPRVLAALRAADPPAALHDLRAAVEATEQSEPREQDQHELRFFGLVDEFLATYGDRGESWDIATPTWGEQGPGFWAQVRHMAGEDVPDPTDALAAAAARRDALAADIDARLAHDEAARARFARRLERIGPYVAVREDRARWQLVATGRLRHAVLRHGARLARAGALKEPGDVLYLLPGEVEDDTAGDLADLAARRHAAHRRLATLVPPSTVGGETSPTGDDTPAAADGLVRGVPASRGLATGTARVITDLADAHRLAPGEVLVCVMTAPPWTPLFAVAAAVVTDTGTAGAHPAIAAREYGIPCVVGTEVATAVIPDGARVTVDGAAGTIRLHP